MRFLWLFAASVLAVSGAQAQTSGISGCNFDNDVDVQIASCTAVISDPKSEGVVLSDAYLYRCQGHDRKGEFEQALKDCQEALRLDADNGSIHKSLSIVYLNLGRPLDAVSAGQRAVQLMPEDSTAFNTLANAACAADDFSRSFDSRMRAFELGRFSAEGLQSALKRRGYYDGPVDDQFGEGSRAALLKWTEAGCP